MRKSLLFLLVLAALGGIFFFRPVEAAVIKESGDLRIEHEQPLFPASEVWYPGKTLTKSVLITNLSTSQTHQAGLKIDITDDSSLSDTLSLEVRWGSETLWGPGSLRDLMDAGEVSLTSLGPGGSTAYDLTVSMASSEGNEYQDKKTVLDFIFGFIAPPTPTASPAGGGGGVGGAAAPVCSAVAPGAPLNLTAITGGAGEVILSWSPSSGTVTHYLIAYGPSSNNYIYGNPNVGKVTSYSVSGLSSGVTYYFVVKGVNDCAPGPFSNEAVGRAGGAGGAFVAAGPATGFEVLGKKKEAAEEGELGGGVSTEAGQTAGVKTEKNCFWSWLLILLAIIGSWLKLRRVKKTTKKHLLIPFSFSLLAFLGDHFAHQWFSPTPFCHLMWLWSLLVFLFGYFIWRRKRA